MRNIQRPPTHCDRRSCLIALHYVKSWHHHQTSKHNRSPAESACCCCCWTWKF